MNPGFETMHARKSRFQRIRRSLFEGAGAEESPVEATQNLPRCSLFAMKRCRQAMRLNLLKLMSIVKGSPGRLAVQVLDWRQKLRIAGRRVERDAAGKSVWRRRASLAYAARDGKAKRAQPIGFTPAHQPFFARPASNYTRRSTSIQHPHLLLKSI
jgi:hypothetical protein